MRHGDESLPLDDGAGVRPPLVIGCGALANELVALTRRAGLPAMDLTCLPASLHNRPERIPAAVAARIRRARAEGYDRIFVAYADCGTGGMLDRVLEAEGVARLEGAHCYEVYAGRAAFDALADEDPGTFYLTDFLARNFERLVVRGLGLDRHPELLAVYFGNYRRLVYLAQTDDAGLTALAEAGARHLGLSFERRFVGLGELAVAITAFGAATPSAGAAPSAAAAPPSAAAAPPSTLIHATASIGIPTPAPGALVSQSINRTPKAVGTSHTGSSLTHAQRIVAKRPQNRRIQGSTARHGDFQREILTHSHASPGGPA